MRNQEPHTTENPHPRKTRRTLLIVAGTVCVILGTVGIFVPLLPTTPFLLLAAACYTRSSDRLSCWLLQHRWFGRYIRNYREHRAITIGTKVLSISLLWITIGYTALAVIQHWALRAGLCAIAIGVTIHLLSLKTATREMLTDSCSEEIETGSLRRPSRTP